MTFFYLGVSYKCLAGFKFGLLAVWAVQEATELSKYISVLPRNRTPIVGFSNHDNMLIAVDVILKSWVSPYTLKV